MAWWFGARLVGFDPLLAPVSGALALAASWAAYRTVGRELTSVGWIATAIAAGIGSVPIGLIGWLGCASFAGGIGAALARRGAQEDDFFFLPAGVAAVGFGIAVAAGLAGSWSEVADLVGRYRDTSIAELERLIEQVRSDPAMAARYDRRVLELARSHWLQIVLVAAAVEWVVAAWAAGRLVRRWTGDLRQPEHWIRHFRIRQRYIFLLIGGLVLEILGVLFGGRASAAAATAVGRVLLAWVAAACFLQAVGVVAFWTSGRGLRAPRWEVVMAAAMLALMALYPPGGIALGLIDVWADLRRLDRRPTG